MSSQTQRYVGLLIEDSRRDTQNAADIPATNQQRGIQDKDFVRGLNYAQRALERKITSLYPFVFQTTQTTTLTANQSTVDITGNLYLNLRIEKVQFSRTGLDTDYVNLTYKQTTEPVLTPGIPIEWYRSNGDVVLSPPVATAGGKVQITYQRTLDSMALRAGQITAITINGSNQVTAITLNTSTDLSDDLTAAASTDPFLCINDRFGNVKVYNIIFSAYDTGTGVVTLTPTSVLDPTNLPAVGDFVTIGQNTTTHSKLPLDCEQFLIEFCNRKVKIRESKPGDWQALDMIAQRLAKEIADAYKQTDTSTVKPIVLTDFGLGMMTALNRSSRFY